MLPRQGETSNKVNRFRHFACSDMCLGSLFKKNYFKKETLRRPCVMTGFLHRSSSPIGPKLALTDITAVGPNPSFRPPMNEVTGATLTPAFCL